MNHFSCFHLSNISCTSTWYVPYGAKRTPKVWCATSRFFWTVTFKTFSVLVE